MAIRRSIKLSRKLSRLNGSMTLACALSLLLVVIAPFSTALAVHHELAAADHDGHEHSDTDLCQWVQYHTGQSLVGDVPAVCSVLHATAPKIQPELVPCALSRPDSVASRAPPVI